MTKIITRVHLTAHMIDRTCQIVYRRIKQYREEVHILKGKLEVIIRTCDMAHRAGNNHLMGLREFQVQTKELQEEMRGDMRGLEEHTRQVDSSNNIKL